MHPFIDYANFAIRTSSPVLLIVMGVLALLIVNLLIGLVEGIVLTLISWNPARVAIKTSFLMNLSSGVINGTLLVLLQHQPMLWLPLSFVVSLVLEFIFLSYIKRAATFFNLIAVVVSNLASYLLLILPAYYFGSHPQ